MKDSGLRFAGILRAIALGAATSLTVSGCCTLSGSDFCFSTPDPNDCPEGYVFVSKNNIDSLNLAKEGRAGVIDREGRGGVIDREDRVVQRFCLPECESDENCLDRREPAVLDTGLSNKTGYVVGGLECVTACTPSQSEDCKNSPVFDDGVEVNGKTPFCVYLDATP